MIQESFLFSVFEAGFLVKLFLIVFLIFYFFFSILLIRQVQIMANSIKTDLNLLLKAVTVGNLLLGLIVLIFAIFS